MLLTARSKIFQLKKYEAQQQQHKTKQNQKTPRGFVTKVFELILIYGLRFNFL